MQIKQIGLQHKYTFFSVYATENKYLCTVKHMPISLSCEARGERPCGNVFFDTFFSKKTFCGTSRYTTKSSIPGNFVHCTFTGKERDEETGYGYFGARYMDHELMTMWLSVDPMADKYPNISPYAYCAWNPVRLVDPDGREIGDYYDTQGKYLGWDGKQDMNVYIVKDQKSINKISSNTSKGKTTSSSDVNIAVSTNYAVMRKAVEVLDMTHERNGKKEFGVSMKGITFSSMQEGTFGGCTIYPVDDGFSGEGASIHSHPNADERNGHWITHPSQVDIDETFCNYDLNIIVGQCERRDMGRDLHNTKFNIQYGAAFYGRPSAGTPREDVKPNVVISENALRNIAYGQVSAACSRMKVE